VAVKVQGHGMTGSGTDAVDWSKSESEIEKTRYGTVTERQTRIGNCKRATASRKCTVSFLVGKI